MAQDTISMEKYNENVHRRARAIAFCAVVVSTVAVLSTAITVPLLYNYIQQLQSHLSNEVGFCMSRAQSLQIKVERIAPSNSNDERGSRTARSTWLFGQFTRGNFGQGAPQVSGEATPVGCCTCHTGLPGPTGEEGAPGLDGLAGRKGEDGPNGQRGNVLPPDPTQLEAPCMKCPTGPPGITGRPGRKGGIGPAGNRGGKGLPGNRGPQGPPGDTGAQGNTGESGGPGARGSPGKLILMNAQPGQIGRPGAQGARGVDGEPGENGNPGRFGMMGRVGNPGPKGKSGVPGWPGNSGEPGLQGSIGGCDHCPSPRTAPGY